MKIAIRRKSMNEQLLDIVADYRAAGQEWPTDTSTIAAWAIRAGKWSPRPEAMNKRLARMFADAMREERFTDPQGRRPRLKHAYPELRVGPDGVGIQMRIWNDMPSMTDKQMRGAAQLDKHWRINRTEATVAVLRGVAYVVLEALAPLERAIRAAPAQGVAPSASDSK